MYLSKIAITNFRGVSSITVRFHSGINILIGENNTGKTAILDALRLCLGFAQERREIYLQPEDFYVGPYGNAAQEIEVHLTFSSPTQREQGVYVEMLCINENGNPEIQLHTRFTFERDLPHRKYWGGANEGQDIPPELLKLFYLTHLGALRHATRDLAPSRGNRLSQLFLKLVDKDDDRERYAKIINEQIRGMSDWQELLAQGRKKIQEHLSKIALQNDPTDVEIQFVEGSFKRILEGLKMLLPRKTEAVSQEDTETDNPEAQPFEISQNGLGANNLIYIATVLGDLLERREKEPDSYIALLIEEPEAHLHPQWQNVLFSYLREIGAKRIQVFVTSHSPTITAKSDIDSIIVLTRSGQLVSSTPLKSIGLSDNQKAYLRRFLDVTKSQLFFARSVILVEGISEALLLPIFADLMGNQYNLEKNAVEIVNINGVAFDPFASLFRNDEETKRISVRCALITDDDRGSGGEASSRAQNALDLQGGLLRVFLAQKTLEYELHHSNEDLMKKCYRELHPQTSLDFPGDDNERASAFAEKVDANRDKAVFAQILASKIAMYTSYKDFIVPNYIQKAIKWAIDGNEINSDCEAEANHQ